MRRLEEKAISSMYSKDDGKDRDMVGIKVGDFEAKSEDKGRDENGSSFSPHIGSWRDT